MQLSNQHRFYLVLASLLVVGFFAWMLAIAPTFDLIRQKSELELELTRSQSVNKELSELESQLLDIESVLGKSGISASEVQQQVLEFIAKNAKEGVTIDSFSTMHEVEDRKCLISTQTVLLSGGFHGLLELINELEFNLEVAQLASVEFNVEQNSRTKKKKLYAEIHLQNIQAAR